MTKIKKSCLALLVAGSSAAGISHAQAQTFNMPAAAANGGLQGLNGEIHASSHIGQYLDADNTMNAAMGALNSHLGLITPGAPQSKHMFKGKVTGWTQITGHLGHTFAGGGAASMKTRYGGFSSGMDTQVGAWVVGGMVSYGRTMLNLGPRSSYSNSNNVTIGGYAGRKWGNLIFNTGLTYGFNMINQSRDVNVNGMSQHLTDGYNGGVLTAKVGFSYLMHPFAKAQSEFFHNATFMPFLDAEYVNEHTDSNNEHGGNVMYKGQSISAALHSESSDKGMAFGAVGFSAGTSFKKFGITWMPSMSANYQHEFMNYVTHNQERFTNQNMINLMSGAGQATNWTVGGNNVSTTVAYTSAGIGAKLDNHWSTNISYFGGYGNYNLWVGGTAGFNYVF